MGPLNGSALNQNFLPLQFAPPSGPPCCSQILQVDSWCRATVVSAQPRGSAASDCSTSALPLVFRQERPAGLSSCPVYFGREAAAPNSSGSLGTLAAPHPPPVHGSDKSAIPDVHECIQLFDCCPLDAASERPRVQKPFHCIYDLGS